MKAPSLIELNRRYASKYAGRRVLLDYHPAVILATDTPKFAAVVCTDGLNLQVGFTWLDVHLTMMEGASLLSKDGFPCQSKRQSGRYGNGVKKRRSILARSGKLSYRPSSQIV